MEILLVIILCGVLSCGLYLGDTAEEFEKQHKIYGPIRMKNAKLSFRVVLRSALVTKMLLGTFVFPSTVVYKLLMKENFYFRLSLPPDFWTKYFKEE